MTAVQFVLDGQQMLRRVDGEVRPLREVVTQQWTGPRKLNTESRYPSSGSSQMYSKSTLSHSDAVSALTVNSVRYASADNRLDIGARAVTESGPEPEF